jgi:hypothetical protein
MNIKCTPAGRALPFPGRTAGVRPFVVLFAVILGTWLPPADAAIRFTAFNSALFKQGYLDVTTYGVVPNDSSFSTATANTQLINEAIKDAYNLNNDTPIWGTGGQTLQGSLVLYFPLGTYFINDTLKVHTATGRWVVASSAPGKYPDSAPKFEGLKHATPGNHLAMVGEATSVPSQRPIIRLRDSSPGFNLPSSPKVMLEFKNFGGIWRDDLDIPKAELGSFVVGTNGLYTTQKQLVEDASRGYHQMLRGIDLHTGLAGNTGVIVLQFNQAQDSSVENVKIIAGSARTGIRGLPGRGWGAVNVEINGGDVGIDLMTYPNPGTGPGIASTSNSGSVIVGAKLTNQRKSAIEFSGFVPLTVVGFEIDHPGSGSEVSTSPLTIEPTPVDPQIPPSDTLYNSLINLIDGKIILHNTAHTAIDNTKGRSLYVRNVYVTGSNNLVTAPAGVGTYTATGAWKRINEYSFTDTRTSNIKGEGGAQVPQSAEKFIDSSLDTELVTASKTNNSGAPVTDLRGDHVWGGLPAVDSANVIDVTTDVPLSQRIVPAVDDLDTRVVDHTKLQDIIDAHSPASPRTRIFLPRGIYRLTGPINLKPNTTLFGAARHLTRIEVAPSWTAKLVSTPALRVETAMITTTGSPTATTYLGDLSIGVDTSDNNVAGDWFTALNWSAGRDSMVHIGQVYRSPAADNNPPTNDHSVLKITGQGGGRWYFAGARKTGHGDDPNFRILEVVPSGTEPLWMYGLNLEHPLGPREYASFSNASNIRIYGEKSEYADSAESAVIRFTNTMNAAVFGMGAIRNGLSGGRGALEFFGCIDVLATLIAPQTHVFSTSVTGSRTVRQTITTEIPPTTGVAYPDVVSLYKDGTLDDTKMTHDANVPY